MAYVKISDMTAASALAGTELVEAVQSSASVKATMAQISTYINANPPSGVTATSAITGEFQFTEDNELDYTASITDGMSAQTVTFIQLPSTTKAIHAAIEIADADADVRILWKRTSGGTQVLSYYGSFQDVGTNRYYDLVWMPTGGNSIYVTTVTAGALRNFKILGYKTGA